MIRAAFFDVDGTLYSHATDRFPESTVWALKQLKEKGIKLFIATGRSYQEAMNIPSEGLVFDGYVTLNGQICTDAEGNMLYGTPIEGPDKEYLVSMFHSKERSLLIVEKDRLYANCITDEVRRAQQSVNIPEPKIAVYEGADIYQFIGYFTREEEPEILKHIPDCRVTRWYEAGVDIIPKNSDKMVGIKKMLEIHGLSREEVIAFGDGDNDAEMLAYAGIGVAMGNAVDLTKEKADYVTSDIDEDGICRALKHFQLIS